jgi:molecular chaperone DnaJ
MDNRKDYYEILGVPRDASRTAIRKAFRRLAREHDPASRCGDPSNALAELQTAYDTLVDADRRRRYDEHLRGQERTRLAAWSSLRRPTTHGDLRRPVRRASLTGEIVLGAREAAGGGLLSLDVPVTATCEACAGTGGPGLDCGHCQGEGKVSRRLPVPVQIPAGIRDGQVFEVRTDDPAVPSLLLTVHLRQL